MSTTRFLPFAALTMTTLALAACGSDANATGSAATAAPSVSCPSGTLQAEGSSAQKNAIEAAIASFQNACTGMTVNYNPTGSGAGIKQFLAGQVDFAGSDSALKAEEAAAAEKRCGAPAWDLPMVAGPIAIAYNLPGVPKLVLSAEVAGKIFAGRITAWNDPAIAALNAGVALPNDPIMVYFRSDESGTTDNFQKYLKAAAGPSWGLEAGKKWNGPIGEGKTKSAGVAGAVKAQLGGLTYVEWSYARQNGLGVAWVDNGGGPVELTGTSVGAMIAGAKQKGTGNDLALDLDYATTAPGAYPINLVTYEIVCSTYSDAAKRAAVTAFLKHFASADVQGKLAELGYAPLPATVADKVGAALDAIG
ncbi:MAG: phosphate ABC transporter substrate-binding protein PstS [Kineosporiaceae bacterium]